MDAGATVETGPGELMRVCMSHGLTHESTADQDIEAIS